MDHLEVVYNDWKRVQMRFVFTLNMPSNRGKAIHQVIGDHPAKDEQELLEALCEAEFVVVEQLYNMNNENDGGYDWQPRGPLIINTSWIGKVQRQHPADRKRSPMDY
jgi:hypothetical protein